MFEFSYQPQVFYGFCRGERRSDRTLIELDWDVDVFLLLNSDQRKQQSSGDMKNTRGMKLRTFTLESRNFWYIVYFVLELLSKLNSFAYNLHDLSI